MQLKKLNVTLFPVRYNDKYYAAALASGDVSKLGIPSATTAPLSSAAWLSEPSQLATSLPTTTARLRFWSMLPHTGRMEEQVEVLQEKLKHTEEEVSIGGKRTKMARSQGKKIHITAEQEYSRVDLVRAIRSPLQRKKSQMIHIQGTVLHYSVSKVLGLKICNPFKLNRRK